LQQNRMPSAMQPPNRIVDFLTRSAAQFPDRAALEFRGQTFTYSDLARRVDATRQDLEGRDVVAGDRLAIVGTNSPQEVALLFAASAMGAWPVLLSARLAPAQLDAILRHCEPRVSLYVGAERSIARDHAVRRGAKPMSLSALNDVCGEQSSSRPEPRAPRSENDVAALIYTSGTTGVPKAAMLSHRNLVFIGLTQRRMRGYTEHDKTYCPLPLSHTGGLTVLLSVTAAGACLRLEEKFTPADLAAAIRSGGVTVVPGLPPLHVKFVEWAAAHPAEFDRGRVRLVTTSSSALHEPVKRAVEALYGCALQNSYGQTEAGIIFQIEANEWRDDTSVGRPTPGLDVRIVDDQGRSVPRGRIGEIQLRGPSVFLGYYRNPEATQAAFTADGWLRTGDLAYMDGADAAFITGRARETIKRSGYTIHPADVEAALNEHASVALSAVVAARRAVDEEVVAFVELKSGSTAQRDELIAFIKQRVAPYELPGDLRLVPRLPTLGNGKIDKVTLRLWASVGTE
jgi:acyl-CoA synthetase (AMP-forming)/AMP-acid ligase II